METIKGDLIMEKDMVFEDSLTVKGNISGKDGDRFNLTVKGDLDCWDLNCWDLDCWDLNCWDLDCENLNGGNLNCVNLDCGNLNCWDLNCGNLDCGDLNFYAIAVAYNSFKCRSWKAERDNYIIKCLDGEIQVEEKE